MEGVDGPEDVEWGLRDHRKPGWDDWSAISRERSERPLITGTE